MQKWEGWGQGTEGQWKGGSEVGEVRGAGVKPKILHALKRYDRCLQAWRGGILTCIHSVASLCVTACCPCKGAYTVIGGGCISGGTRGEGQGGAVGRKKKTGRKRGGGGGGGGPKSR